MKAQPYLHAARTHWWFRARRRVVAAIVQPLVTSQVNGIVVDVGSGPGGLARGLFPARHLVAIDVMPEMLQAYEQADARIVGDGARLPCRTAGAAAVCAFDVLEHLENDLSALQDWGRVLAPGGHLLLTVPAYQGLWGRHDDANGHYRRYRARPLRRLLSAAGFDVVRMTYFNTLLLPAVALVRWSQRALNGRMTRPTATPGPLDFEFRLPGWLARCCEQIFSAETLWLRRRNCPAGVSLCVVAQKLLTPA